MTTKTEEPIVQTPALPPSRGSHACEWIELNCVYGEGDFRGQPVRLRLWEEDFIYRAYEEKSSGDRLWRQVLLGLPRGNGKTQLAALIASYELFGAGRSDPVVVVAAASWEQADLVFGALKANCREGPLSRYAEVYDTEILRRGAPGRAYRVAAVAGTNEGQRPTCVIADELHEWLGSKERMWTVLTSGAAKRADSFTLAITTAGWDRDSLCYKLYERGKRIRSGEEDPDGFMFEWYEAPEGAEIDDPQVWRACNPALGDFLQEENLRQQRRVIPEHEFERYHLNRWVARYGQWLPPGKWEALEAKREVSPDEPVVVGFDGSYGHDSTALVRVTLDGYISVLKCWERPDDAKEGWAIPRAEVDAAVAEAMEGHKVRELVCDPHRWSAEIQAWQERYGNVVFDFNTATVPLMSPACARFYAAVASGEGLSHDGDPRLKRHLYNAVTKPHRDGEYITKEHHSSPRKIDLAVASVIAYDRAMVLAGKAMRRSIYEERGVQLV